VTVFFFVGRPFAVLIRLERRLPPAILSPTTPTTSCSRCTRDDGVLLSHPRHPVVLGNFLVPIMNRARRIFSGVSKG